MLLLLSRGAIGFVAYQSFSRDWGKQGGKGLLWNISWNISRTKNFINNGIPG
jgi:hypothetical protein